DHGVKTELGKWQRKASQPYVFKEVPQHLNDLRSLIHVFVLHHCSIAESCTKAVGDSCCQAPSQPPEKSSFSRNAGLKNNLQVLVACRSGHNARQVRQVFQDSDRQNAIVASLLWNIEDVVIEGRNARAVWAVLPERMERFNDLVAGNTWLTGDMVQRASSKFQNAPGDARRRNGSVHPRFQGADDTGQAALAH